MDDELFAHHEAGHAVAMWLLGFGVKTVSIEPKAGLNGYAEPRAQYSDSQHDDVCARRLSGLRGGGPKTVAEILAAASRAGVRMGPPTI